MTVFISHKDVDANLAKYIADRLKKHGISAYLDVVDDTIDSADQHIADYLLSRLGECTSLLAVITASTRDSWWVPWEIGVATEKEYPIASYIGEAVAMPAYLRKWPYLVNGPALDKYASRLSQLSPGTEKFAESTGAMWKVTGAVKESMAKTFHRVLKADLGQR